MDVTLIVLVSVVIVLLLLVVFMLVNGNKNTASELQKKEAKKHKCLECLFLKEDKCVYFHEDNVDGTRPACKHYEEKDEYRPA